MWCLRSAISFDTLYLFPYFDASDWREGHLYSPIFEIVSLFTSNKFEHISKSICKNVSKITKKST